SPGRAIPIVRIHVTPHLADSTRFAAFDGEIDLDATRHQIVRMRGQFVVLGRDHAVMRIMSKFTDYQVDDTSNVVVAPNDSLRVHHVTTWAASDSVSSYGGWQSALGDATTGGS